MGVVAWGLWVLLHARPPPAAPHTFEYAIFSSIHVCICLLICFFCPDCGGGGSLLAAYNGLTMHSLYRRHTHGACPSLLDDVVIHRVSHYIHQHLISYMDTFVSDLYIPYPSRLVDRYFVFPAVLSLRYNGPWRPVMGPRLRAAGLEARRLWITCGTGAPGRPLTEVLYI